MIISCPECHKEISDQAIQCPCCGLPSKPTMSNGSTIDQFVVSPVISKPHSKLEMVATVLSCVVKVTRNAWRPQLWIASFMAIGWAVVSVILIIDLMKGVEDVRPVIKEAADVSSLHIEQARLQYEQLKKEHLGKELRKKEQREKVRRLSGDRVQEISEERTKLSAKEVEKNEISKKIDDKRAEMAAHAKGAHEARLVGNGPFELPPKPTGFIDSWWDYVFSDLGAKCKEYNDTYNQMNAAIGTYNKGIQDAKAAIATASKRIDSLHGLISSYEEELISKSLHPEEFLAVDPEAVPKVVIVEVSQSPWLKTVLFIIHATIIPITLILVLSSLLRVIVLAEWLEPMRLVSK